MNIAVWVLLVLADMTPPLGEAESMGRHSGEQGFICVGRPDTGDCALQPQGAGRGRGGGGCSLLHMRPKAKKWGVPQWAGCAC